MIKAESTKSSFETAATAAKKKDIKPKLTKILTSQAEINNDSSDLNDHGDKVVLNFKKTLTKHK